MSADQRIVVIGAGPTGLGAAWRLNELQHTNWALYESTDHPGGLASSVVDSQGFTWDMGGHVLFLTTGHFDELMMTALGDEWVEHVREAWIWMRERWIPFPLQNNIWRLPEDELMTCLEGLLDVYVHRKDQGPPASFRDWLLTTFGRGLCETFMIPYNKKVWAYEPDRLDVGWMGERVATVDFPRVLRNLVFRRDDVGWGPNSTFRFPLRGGTGAIWRAVIARLPSDRICFNRTVAEIDVARRVLIFRDGETARYDALISTMPLDVLLRALRGRGDLTRQADRFVHSSSHIVGVGLAGRVPESLRTKCWIYFPESQVPFYRATVFSNYSPNNVPEPGRQWSLMAEISESADKPVDAERILAEAIAGLRSCHFIDEDSVIVTRFHRRLDYGYPTPWLRRDEVLDEVNAELQKLGILSRGRFGAWKYEVSNQDHSLMQGVEAVDHLRFGAEERTYQGHMSD
jgi:protoporphyrinogen oxidase